MAVTQQSHPDKGLRLLDLSEFKFDPRYAAEYRQCRLKPGTGLIDLLYDATEGSERTGHHTDRVILPQYHECFFSVTKAPIGHGHLHHQHGISPTRLHSNDVRQVRRYLADGRC
jgi:hypothetical protein